MEHMKNSITPARQHNEAISEELEELFADFDAAFEEIARRRAAGLPTFADMVIADAERIAQEEREAERQRIQAEQEAAQKSAESAPAAQEPEFTPTA